MQPIQPARFDPRPPQLGGSVSTAPAVVTWGLGIQWVGVAFSAIGLFIALAGLIALGGAAVGGVSDATAFSLVGVLVGVAAVIVAVQIVVLVFATMGRNWARVTLAVLVILALVLSLASGQGLNIGSAISILSVALLFMPDATAWYRARSGQR